MKDDSLWIPFLYFSGVISGFLLFVLLDDFLDVLWWHVFDWMPDNLWLWLRSI